MPAVFRIAIREDVEKQMVTAHLAYPHTMAGALNIMSIHMAILDNDPTAWPKFQELARIAGDVFAKMADLGPGTQIVTDNNPSDEGEGSVH